MKQNQIKMELVKQQINYFLAQKLKKPTKNNIRTRSHIKIQISDSLIYAGNIFIMHYYV